MMLPSRTITYAIRAMLKLASAEPGVPIPCSELASPGRMPERYLLQILRSLVNHGLLQSTRGVVGGFCLAQPPAEITLCDIHDALDYPLEPSPAAFKGFKSDARDRLMAAFDGASRASRRELQKVTVADLLHGTRPSTHKSDKKSSRRRRATPSRHR
jgi:Rrf2 family protein